MILDCCISYRPELNSMRILSVKLVGIALHKWLLLNKTGLMTITDWDTIHLPKLFRLLPS